MKSKTKPAFENTFEKGLDEDVVRKISKIKNEPKWVLDFRLKAYRFLLTQELPNWQSFEMPEIDLQKISYYSNTKDGMKNKKLSKTLKKLGLTNSPQLGMSATDIIVDSKSVGMTISDIAKQKLQELGIIFCPISVAIINYPKLFQKYFASVVPPTDNYFATLNSAVFSDGTFVYIPPKTKCPVELSSYFRLNTEGVGQFERTLIIADKGSSVNYLEGCTAPAFSSQQLHSAVVELVAMEDAQIKYATVQNWYAGTSKGVGGVWNFVTKRGLCEGKNSKISWTQVETGSAITWKYPSVVLKGGGSSGQFYSLALTKNQQQADTGTKMTHIGKNTKSLILAKSVVLGNSKNTYRGRVKVIKNADGAKNFTKCDALLIRRTGKKPQAITLPEIDNQNPSADLEHEASSGKVSASQLDFLQSRGLNPKTAQNLLIFGFCREIFKQLPFEFVVEAKGLLEKYL
jgi:Fe-S cluster assembly protein SufB